jgi:hypothetical protein
MPEKVEVLQVREKIKAAAVASNDPPRTIIREETLNMTESGMAAMTRRDALRQLINRTRNYKLGHGFNAKCLSQIEIPEELRKLLKMSYFIGTIRAMTIKIALYFSQPKRTLRYSIGIMIGLEMELFILRQHFSSRSTLYIFYTKVKRIPWYTGCCLIKSKRHIKNFLKWLIII